MSFWPRAAAAVQSAAAAQTVGVISIQNFIVDAESTGGDCRRSPVSRAATGVSRTGGGGEREGGVRAARRRCRRGRVISFGIISTVLIFLNVGHV
jgi:hypothetical protein